MIPEQLGLTTARLERMVLAYQDRRARELRDLASATAFAMHEPKRIDKAIKAPNKAKDKNWVQERWWGRGKADRWHETG